MCRSLWINPIVRIKVKDLLLILGVITCVRRRNCRLLVLIVFQRNPVKVKRGLVHIPPRGRDDAQQVVPGVAHAAQRLQT